MGHYDDALERYERDALITQEYAAYRQLCDKHNIPPRGIDEGFYSDWSDLIELIKHVS
jgi:hypothetical protein